MKGFQFSEHIACAPHEVFAVIADPTRATDFLEGITASVKLTEGPIGVGSAFRETRVVGGREASADLVVVAHDPHSHVGISTEAEGVRVVYHYRLLPEGTGTRLDWVCELEASGLRRMLLPVMATIMKKEDGDHLRRLKDHLESRSQET